MKKPLIEEPPQFKEARLIKRALKENTVALFLTMYDVQSLPPQEERALEAAICSWLCRNPVAWHIAVDEYKGVFPEELK